MLFVSTQLETDEELIASDNVSAGTLGTEDAGVRRTTRFSAPVVRRELAAQRAAHGF